MIGDYDDDTHFCLKCHATILGLDNYVNHRKAGCSKNLGEPSKSPLPSQLLPPDESFGLKADDFFSSLELRSSSKKTAAQSTSGKNFSGILTRSKTTAVIQATSGSSKDANDPQQSKSGKNVWIGGHQLKELGYGDNQSKLIKAVANLERRKEEPTRLEVEYEESDEESEEYDYDVDDYSDEDQDVPPRNYTGGKWKPSSPIQWSRNAENRDWNVPPLSHTGGKWKPKRSNSPPATHTKGKWKPTYSSQVCYDVPPPTFTGSKWVSSKKQDYQEVPPPTHTKGKWKPRIDNEDDFPPPNHTKGKWRPKNQTEDDYPPPTHTKGKWKPKGELDEDYPPPTHTKGKWKPKNDIDDDFPPPTHTKGKWKPKNDTEEDFPPPGHTKGKWKPKNDTEDDFPPPGHTKGKWKPKNDTEDDFPPPGHTKGKWKPRNDTEDYFPPPGHTKGKWKPKNDNEDDFPPPGHTKGKWKPKNDTEDDFPPPGHTKGKWKPKNDLDEDFSPPGHTKGKWNPKTDNDDAFPPPSHTKGKWKPKSESESSLVQPMTTKTKQNEVTKPSPSKESKKPNESKKTGGGVKRQLNQISSKPEEDCTKDKWIPPPQNKELLKITDDSALRESTGGIQYWCNPCNRRLASKVVYERHLKSELHFKRTLHDREFDDSDDLNILKDARRAKIKPPEPIFSGQEKNVFPVAKKRNRKKIYTRCEVCQSKVNRHLIGKHLISHYHCRKGDITTSVARSMVLDNIHGIVLQCPFQCSICKFYCNTHQDFLRHWLSEYHVNKKMPGFFFCNFCNFRSDDTDLMYKHLVSPEHNEVVSVINQSVPIVIKKINPIHCLTCNKEFLLNMQLLNHCKRFNHDDSVVKIFKSEYVCEPCGEGFLSNVSLQRHRQHVHKEKYYFCTQCNLKFDDARKAKLHRRSVQHRYSCLSKSSGNKILKRKCEYCDETFANFLLLKEHLKSKHPEHKIRCPHCGANFTIAQELTSHLRSKSCKFEENSENTFRCEKCPFSSNSTSELLFHVALHNEPLLMYPTDKEADSKTKPIYRYKCPVCDKFFPKSSLEAHIRQHTQERPFECKICNAKFARKNNLQFHVKNHEKKTLKKQSEAVAGEPGERPFLCSTCGANFRKKSILQQHMQIHTGKLCKCPKLGCVYAARKMSEIKEHFKTHSDVKNFACQLCDYKGKTKQQLNRHITVHDDTKKYQCPQCPFTTRTSTHLRRHARLHTGAKPFSCPHCSYKCNNLENLRKHVLSTNKHPGKCIYECKFCTEDHFQGNFAKEFKAHLVTRHAEMFGNGAEAATYVAGIYEVQDDSTDLNDIADIDQTHERNMVPQTSKIDDTNENILELKTDEDPIVSQLSTSAASASEQTPKNRILDQMLPMFIIPKDESMTVEISPDTWNLVGRYDVEEESGTLIPFQSDGESLFQEHF